MRQSIVQFTFPFSSITSIEVFRKWLLHLESECQQTFRDGGLELVPVPISPCVLFTAQPPASSRKLARSLRNLAVSHEGSNRIWPQSDWGKKKFFSMGLNKGHFFKSFKLTGQSEIAVPLAMYLTSIYRVPTMCKTLKKDDEKDSVPFLMEQTKTVPWPKLECNYISPQRSHLPPAPYPCQVAPMGLHKPFLLFQL